jgi:hypothetical protein
LVRFHQKFQMCYAPTRAYESPEDFNQRAIRKLKKKFARAKTNNRATKKLFQKYQHLQTIGLRLGFSIYFLYSASFKKGSRNPKYKLVIKKRDAETGYAPLPVHSGYGPEGGNNRTNLQYI